MARSQRNAARNRRKYLVYLIPIVALVSVSILYALIVLPPPSTPAAMDFSFKLLVNLSNGAGDQVRAYAPGNAIGEAGGFWATNRFNAYSVDATHYPLYMDSPYTACTPSCLIHVRSRILYQYTLQDFFDVWGQTLGVNNTVSIPAKPPFTWEMCIGPSPNTATISDAWGGYVLQSNTDITLFHYNSTNPGCALS